VRSLVLALAGSISIVATVSAPVSAEEVAIVTVEIGAGDPIAVEETISGLLRAVPVEVRTSIVEGAIDRDAILHPPGSPAAAVARIWIEVSADEALIWIADDPWERVLVRRVPRAQGDAIAREEIGQIVAGAVEALRAGAQIGILRRELVSARPMPTTASPTAPRSPPNAVRPFVIPAVAIGYEGLAWSRRSLSHGVTVTGSFRGGGRGLVPTLALFGSARLPLDEGTDDLGIRVETFVTRLLGGVALPVGARARLRADVGIGLDLARVDPRARTRGVEASAPRTLLAPMLRGAIAVDLPVTGGSAFSIGIVTDVDLAPRTYLVTDGERTEVVADPSRLRPGLSIAWIADLGSP
jgi:hypothetical protein